MLTVDDARTLFREIAAQFKSFCEQNGEATEADTRAQVIDRILTEVCGWPEAQIVRERHVDRGYMDYCLIAQSRKYVAVEAKREGIGFQLPTGRYHRSLSLSGPLLTDAAVKAAVEQVRGYCDDAGIRYAVATNGYAWIIFRAIREDTPWRKGHARVFASLQEIDDHFTDFWNLLSFEAIASGALDAEFGAPPKAPRRLRRVVDNLYNADLPLQRNRLHAQLHPLIATIFEDIADQEQIEILQSCYVHSISLRIVADDLNCIITDAIPQFLLDQGAEAIRQGPDNAGRFGAAMARAIPSSAGQLFLLLGGVGSGKTTFIKRYERSVGREQLEQHAVWFHLDFLTAPLDPARLEDFVWQAILEQLRARYSSPHLETRRNIKRAFQEDIDALTETALRHLREGTEEYELALSPYLAEWQADVTKYVPRLLAEVKPRRDIKVVVFIDNVDQLSPAYQGQIFLLAQRITRTINSTTIVALREESYYTANLQRTLTAYTNRKFHIASPHFRRMIGNRIDFALKFLGDESQLSLLRRDDQIVFDREAVRDFLSIVEYSIFEHNRNIARFIESLCFGNMRMALEMFTTFLTSGATDVDKMLSIYRREGAYFVAFHEFVKSIMLGERRYYKSSASPILNLFECSADRNSSHFTPLRLLSYLLSRRSEASREGQGYVDIGSLVSLFEDVFDNREDVLKSLTRLLANQLVEVNTRSTESIAGASHVRATSAGWYYRRHLVKTFAYIDLVLQDTPIDNSRVEAALSASIYRVDNLADREDEKIQRMDVRSARVRQFLDYLQEQEAAEHAGRDVVALGGVIGERVMPDISAAVHRQIEWIERRVRENRERIKDDVVLTSPEGEDDLVPDDDGIGPTAEPG